jgi:hypothetical protein
LIDDELANANAGNNSTKVSKQLICEPQHYTIYERFQDIEHALDGDELIYDLWKNWGSRTDVQFRLKINKTKDSDSEDDRKSTKSKVTTSRDQLSCCLRSNSTKLYSHILNRRYAMQEFRSF